MTGNIRTMALTEDENQVVKMGSRGFTLKEAEMYLDEAPEPILQLPITREE